MEKRFSAYIVRWFTEDHKPLPIPEELRGKLGNRFDWGFDSLDHARNAARELSKEGTVTTITEETARGTWFNGSEVKI
jgi:hypothetical protein